MTEKEADCLFERLKNRDEKHDILDVLTPSKEEIEKIKQEEKLSLPSDHITLTGRGYGELTKLWRKNWLSGHPLFKQSKITGIPADLLWSGTVPLLDCAISLVAENPEALPTVSQIRVQIFENYKDLIKQGGDACIHVGNLYLYEDGVNEKYWFQPFSICKSHNYILPMDAYSSFEDRNGKRRFIRSFNISQDLFNALLSAWFSIQILLLNPRAKMLFAHASYHKLKGKEKIEAKKGQRKTKYIRFITILDSEIDEMLYGGDEERKRARLCLAWYVIGHWRHYKNGKTVFIEPYWKGELRALRRNIDSEREREIDEEALEEDV